MTRRSGPGWAAGELDALLGAAVINAQLGAPAINLQCLNDLFREPDIRRALRGWTDPSRFREVRGQLSLQGSSSGNHAELISLERLLRLITGLRVGGYRRLDTPCCRVLEGTAWLMGRHLKQQNMDLRPPATLGSDEARAAISLMCSLRSPQIPDRHELAAFPQLWTDADHLHSAPGGHSRTEWRTAALWAAEWAAHHPEAPSGHLSGAWQWPAWLMGWPRNDLIETVPEGPCPDGWSQSDHADASTAAQTLGQWWASRPGSPGDYGPFYWTHPGLEETAELNQRPWRSDAHGPWQGHGLSPEWRLLCRLPVPDESARLWLGHNADEIIHLGLRLLGTRQARTWLRATKARPPESDDPVFRLKLPSRPPGRERWEAEVIRRALEESPPLPRPVQLALASLALTLCTELPEHERNTLSRAARRIQTGGTP